MILGRVLDHCCFIKSGQFLLCRGIIKHSELHIWLHGSFGLNYRQCLPLLYFQEHEKRCWSVDFNLMDPKLLASGSDDAKGKWGATSDRIGPTSSSLLCYNLFYIYPQRNVDASVFVFQWNYGQPISTTQWPASRPKPMSAVLSSVQPRGIIWPLAVQVR